MTSLYIHIPFCKKKCNYCDFVSYAGKESLIDKYVESLIKEITSLFSTCPERSRGTIYFGGGTPALLKPKHFDQILNTLISHFEISVESNPGTADKASLKALRQLGINRLSIGVQSFKDKHLKRLGRIHTAKQALGFFEDARATGFGNINLDLMFALPNQTLAEWQADIQQALALNPEHLSIYNLQIEEGTPFWGKGLSLPTEDVELKMYEYAIDTLTSSGYKHYEISNFAKPGFECRHNINYWRNGNYLGFGAGAHSHVAGKRWSNPNCVETYIKNAKRMALDDSHGAADQHETLFLGLRLLDGIAIEYFAGFEKEVEELIKDGLLEEANGNYRLTRQGLFLGNLVFEKFV